MKYDYTRDIVYEGIGFTVKFNWQAGQNGGLYSQAFDAGIEECDIFLWQDEKYISICEMLSEDAIEDIIKKAEEVF